ncbi:MAG: trypsin-like peptidase domain-containing protein [Deltaproteobacteria bacterium]|nr:trypsin-like peptidase domain-containing protein [Nannocystaceae bacterium]
MVPSVAMGAPTQKPWRGELAVRACALDPLELPTDTEIALHATLLVQVDDEVGSAVVISPDGFALTAAHVVGTATSVIVVAYNHAKLRAEVVRVDEIQDVALLEVEGLGDAKCLQPVSGNASIGSDVFVLGSPAGAELSFSVAKGIVSAYRDLAGLRFVQVDASLNPGNSGGPVVDATGRVVGIASWKVSHVAMEGLAFAVPIDVAIASLDIELGESSASDWRELGGRRAEASTDVPRSTAAPASPEQIERAAASRRRVTIRTGLLAGGGTVAGFGALSVIATGAAYYAGSRMGPGAWRTAVAFNTIGWVMVGLGTALVGSGLLVRKKPKTRARAALAFGRDGMKVSF